MSEQLRRWQLIPVALSFILMACGTNLNEGSVYPTTLPVGTDAANGTSALTRYGQMFYAADTVRPGNDGTLIGKDENFSVTLVSGFICDFREDFLPFFLDTTNKGATPCAGGDGGASAGTRGEIAVIANVVERNSSSGNSISQVYDDRTRAGRVIYYGEDVRETGQLINARNMPLYGPVRYGNGSLYMKFSILEFDETEAKQTREMLKQLADIGTQSGIFASIPVLRVLHQLGDALVSQNRDDVEFLFEMQLDSPSKLATVHRAPLREGYLVMLRQENRSADLATTLAGTELRFCPESGILATDADCTKIFRDTTWLVLRVSREDADVALANNAGQAFDVFNQRLLEQAQNNATALSIENGTTQAALADLLKKLGALEDNVPVQGSQVPDIEEVPLVSPSDPETPVQE